MLLRCFFILCLLTKTCFAQENSKVKQIINSNNLKSSEKIIKIDSILIQLEKYNKPIKNEIQHYIVWLHSQRKFHKTLKLASNTLKIQNNNIIDSVYKQNLYYYLGLSTYQLQRYDQSISYFQSAIGLLNDNNIAGKVYFNLGKCYHKKLDYYQSIKFYELGRNLLLKYNDLDQLFKSYVNITLPYNKLKTKAGYLKSRAYFFKADSLIPYTSIGEKFKYVVKMGLGNSYNKNETLDIQKASYYYKEAITITRKNKDSFHLGIAYSRLGDLYNTTNPDLGIKYQTKRLSYLPKVDSLQYSIAYNNIAYCYANKRCYEESIFSNLKSVNYLTGYKIENRGFIQKKLLLKPFKKNRLLIRLKDLASTYFNQYKASRDIAILDQSINAFSLADQLLDLILIESQELQSKLFWRKQSAELYGKAIEACYLLGDLEKAFYFMEKNKALLLTENLKNQQLKQALNLPDSIVKKEIDLKRHIYDLEHQNTIDKNKDSISIALLSVKRELKKLQDDIQQNFAAYKAIDLKTNVIKLEALQNSLDAHTAVLAYNISQYDDYGLITSENEYTPVIPNCKYGVKTFHPAYGLLITKDSVNFFKLKNVENLKNEVRELVSMMRSPFKTESDIVAYKNLSFKIYSALLPSEALQGNIQNKNVRIIPDNFLNYLPFEALMTSKGDKASYWVQENEISYAFSNSFLNNITNQNSNNATSFVGFAPVTYDSLALSTLQNSLEELHLVSDYFSGTTYSYKTATKKQFLETLSHHDIVHLVTHADAQDSISPWIAFRDKKLLQDELSLTTNHAKMVVLSGCNTLLGKQEIGEGVMSLARSFFQSGAKSVVSSLWNVDDRSTATIMNTFYKNLKKGESKSRALQNAKIEYLDNHSLSEASPFYWASFVILGDTVPLISTSKYYGLYSFLILFALIFLFFFLRKD